MFLNGRKMRPVRKVFANEPFCSVFGNWIRDHRPYFSGLLRWRLARQALSRAGTLGRVIGNPCLSPVVCANNSAFEKEKAGLIELKTKKNFIFAFGCTAILSLFYGLNLGSMSFLLGPLLIFFSMWTFGLLFRRVISKKSIAGNTMIIVFKYAILAVCLFFAARAKWFSFLNFALGLGAFVLIFAIHTVVQERMREG